MAKRRTASKVTTKTKGKAGELDRRVGQNVRLYRDIRGFTQEQLGDALGMSFQQIQKYECGLNRVSAGNLYRIATLFNLPLEAFYLSPPVPRQG